MLKNLVIGGLYHDHCDEYIANYFESRVDCKETEGIGEIFK